MNFDFMKSIKSLSFIYKNCNNAEELAKSYPDQSLVASRKGAEALARLIYMEAHTEEMERMTFDAVLKDQAVRRFIRRRDILDAFYNIKQKGNAGAHADEREVLTPEDAIDVLWDLHFVTGEIAIKMGLVEDYPEFDENIRQFPEARALEDENLIARVKEMYLAFEEAYKEEKLINSLEESDIRYAVTGIVDMREHLCFDQGIKYQSTARYIQEYLSFLVQMAQERSAVNMPDLYDPVVFNATLILNNADKYSSENIEQFVKGINAISSSVPFMLDLHVNGNLREYYEAENESGEVWLNMINSNSVWNGTGMYEELLSKKHKEGFVYKQVAIYLDAGEINCLKIEDGKDYSLTDLLERSTTNILSDHPLDSWFAWMPSIHIEFDQNKYPKQIDRFVDAARKHMAPYYPDQNEKDWIDIDEDEVRIEFPQILDDLNDLQSYLDDINEAIYEFDDLDDFEWYIIRLLSTGANCPSTMWISEVEFAVATIDWLDDEIKVIGTLF